MDATAPARFKGRKLFVDSGEDAGESSDFVMDSVTNSSEETEGSDVNQNVSDLEEDQVQTKSQTLASPTEYGPPPGNFQTTHPSVRKSLEESIRSGKGATASYRYAVLNRFYAIIW